MPAYLRVLAGLLLSVISLAGGAQSSSSLSLHDALEIALQRHPAGNVAGQQRSSSWLAGLPSIGVSYLDTQEQLGTDEAEISLNLPIKSRGTRGADKALLRLSSESAVLSEEQRALYFSGLIREAAWGYRLADAQRRLADKKRIVLEQLVQQQSALVEANAASTYTLLTLQKELVDTQLQQQAQLTKARSWLNQFRRVTGLGQIPTEIAEKTHSRIAFQAGTHPALRALQNNFAQQHQQLVADRASNSDWDLAIVATNIDGPGFEENQWGLAAELPLSFIDNDSQSNLAQFKQARSEYLTARLQLEQQLLAQWQRATTMRDNLQARQALLDKSAELTGRIAAQVQDLWANKAIAPEIALRRVLDAQDAVAQRQLNELYIQHNIAMLRQAAGVSL